MPHRQCPPRGRKQRWRRFVRVHDRARTPDNSAWVNCDRDAASRAALNCPPRASRGKAERSANRPRPLCRTRAAMLFARCSCGASNLQTLIAASLFPAEVDLPLAGVNVQPAFANEANQRHATFARELDGETRWRKNGAHDRNASGQRLLQNLERRAPAHGVRFLRSNKSSASRLRASADSR